MPADPSRCGRRAGRARGPPFSRLQRARGPVLVARCGDPLRRPAARRLRPACSARLSAPSCANKPCRTRVSRPFPRRWRRWRFRTAGRTPSQSCPRPPRTLSSRPRRSRPAPCSRASCRCCPRSSRSSCSSPTGQPLTQWISSAPALASSPLSRARGARDGWRGRIALTVRSLVRRCRSWPLNVPPKAGRRERVFFPSQQTLEAIPDDFYSLSTEARARCYRPPCA